MPVTVLERDDRPGGLLMYGIPNMKLDKREVVERRLRLMEEEGIKFICNAHVGDNVEAMLLLKDFDATVICTGATQPRDLPVEGRNLKGIHFAMDYLTAQHQGAAGRRARRIPDTCARQGRDCPRRWRHRHRLRGHRDAPGMPEPDPARDPAEAADGSRRGQSMARVAESLPPGLRPGRSRRPIRRRPARLSARRSRNSSATPMVT